MHHARVIPVLLLKGRGLYKTRGFSKPVYIGDPINTLRIFNDKEVDEIILLDIAASKEGRGPDFEQIEAIISESFMPLAYGGGVSTYEQAMRLLEMGIEKIVLNTHALENPELITRISDHAGAQAVIAAVDAKKKMFGGARAYGKGGSEASALTPQAWAAEAVRRGSGELMVTSIDHEGEMTGYDINLIKSIASIVDVPVIAHGGAGSMAHLRAALEAGASAVAAGSLFVFQGPHRAVLISYPNAAELQKLRA